MPMFLETFYCHHDYTGPYYHSDSISTDEQHKHLLSSPFHKQKSKFKAQPSYPAPNQSPAQSQLSTSTALPPKSKASGGREISSISAGPPDPGPEADEIPFYDSSGLLLLRTRTWHVSQCIFAAQFQRDRFCIPSCFLPRVQSCMEEIKMVGEEETARNGG